MASERWVVAGLLLLHLIAAMRCLHALSLGRWVEAVTFVPELVGVSGALALLWWVDRRWR